LSDLTSNSKALLYFEYHDCVLPLLTGRDRGWGKDSNTLLQALAPGALTGILQGTHISLLTYEGAHIPMSHQELHSRKMPKVPTAGSEYSPLA